MLSNGLRVAPSTCLRCQLRQVIFPRLQQSVSPPQCHARKVATTGRRLARTNFERGSRSASIRLVHTRPRENRVEDDEIAEKEDLLPETSLKPEEERNYPAEDHKQWTLYAPLQLEGKEARKAHSVEHGQHTLYDRVIGKPGHLQRVRSATLKSTTMGKPFDVTVMHDVADAKDGEADEQRPVIMEEIERHAVQGHDNMVAVDQEPGEQEAIESIEALRPVTTMLHGEQFNALARTLRDSYNTKQLSMYLAKTLQFSSTDADVVQIRPKSARAIKDGLQRSIWQPGTTPIDERPGRGVWIRKNDVGRSKPAVISQILRFAWHLTNTSEWQSVGELELFLRPWQFSYLFDRLENGESVHQSLIETPLLRKISKISSHRPDSVMRITARRMDAEEIADRIEQKLRQIKSVSIDLENLPATPDDVAGLLDKSIHAEVAARTGTVIELEHEKFLTIYGSSDSKLHSARRTLLSVLDLPSPRVVDTVHLQGLHFDRQEEPLHERPVFAPEHDLPGLALRYRGLKLGRLVLPTQRATIGKMAPAVGQDNTSPISTATGDASADLSSKSSTTQLDASALHIAQRLADLPSLYSPPRRRKNDDDGLWKLSPSARSATWRVEFCRVLHPHSEIAPRQIAALPTPRRSKMDETALANVSGSRKLSVVQHQIPQSTSLLSFLAQPRTVQSPAVKLHEIQTPSRAIPIRSTLVAHYIPAPSSAAGSSASAPLPPIELLYKHTEVERPINITAILSAEEVRVPLPAEAVDLRFVRQVTMASYAISAITEIGFGKVISRLRESPSDAKSSLLSTEVIKVKLPVWLAASNKHRKRSSASHVTVDYICDRVEEVRHYDFVSPVDGKEIEGVSDHAMLEVLNKIPPNVYLRFKEINGGCADERGEWSLNDPAPFREYRDRIPVPHAVPRSVVRTVMAAAAGESEGEAFGSDRKGNKEGREGGERMPSVATLRLVQSGLRVARALTRLNSGELKPAWADTDGEERRSSVRDLEDDMEWDQDDEDER